MRGQYQIYKGTGALQASLISYNQKEHKTGAIYLEAANCKDKKNRTYDWANKIKFALGNGDLTQIFDMVAKGTPAEVKMFHVQGGASAAKDQPGKRLVLKPGEGQYKGTWLFYFDDQTIDTKVMVSMTAGEFKIFLKLIEASLPSIYGFDSYGSYGAAVLIADE